MGRDRGPGRGFREVDIAVTSVQPGVERFQRFEEDGTVYPASWRNNLTGLSQHANLYFVGVLDEIHVYEPQFPTQRLPKRIFAWRVATSGIPRRGFIRPGNPHWINRLVVGDCGTEEVIATAHDEGDFIVCTVRSVCHAIEAYQALGLKAQDAVDRFIRYLCRMNVDQSAWGIAIHQNARILAVSANTKKITVIAPGLVPDSEREDAPSNADKRNEDRVYRLSGHDANIPCIAFCNTEDDRDGRFLVSTDINGGIIIWDIWKQCGLKKIAMSVGPEDGHIIGDNFLGWSVTCIDPRSFRSVSNDVEFVGFNRQNNKKSATTVDISPARKHLRDFQFWHESDPRHIYAQDRLFLSQGSPALSGDEIEDEDEEDAEDGDDDDDDDDEYDDDDDDDDDEDLDDDDMDIPEHLALPPIWEMLDEWEDLRNDEAPDEMYDTIDFGPPPATAPNPVVEEIVERPESTSDSVRSLPVINPIPPITLTLPPAGRHPPFAPHGRSIGPHWSRIPPPPAPKAPKAPEPEFPFAILHSGKRIVTLLRPPFDTATAVCIDPCHEHLPPAVHSLGSFERLNLSSYIPELGVAVLATQKGRAAIFTFTTLPSSVAAESSSSTRSRPRPRPSNRRSSSDGASVGDIGLSFPDKQNSVAAAAARYAIRLDWVVPFKSQENRNQRPWSPLLGIATAPVQGCQSKGNPVTKSGEGVNDVLNRFGGVAGKTSGPEASRWRLFLTYADNTILTYDLFREERSERLLVF